MTQINDIHSITAEALKEVPAANASPWQPLRQRVFRMLWIATVVSNIGSWMNDIGVNWTMLTLSADPLSVAMVRGQQLADVSVCAAFRGDGGYCRSP